MFAVCDVLYCGVQDAAILKLPPLIPRGLALMIRPIDSALDRRDDGVVTDVGCRSSYPF